MLKCLSIGLKARAGGALATEWAEIESRESCQIQEPRSLLAVCHAPRTPYSHALTHRALNYCCPPLWKASPPPHPTLPLFPTLPCPPMMNYPHCPKV